MLQRSNKAMSQMSSVCRKTEERDGQSAREMRVEQKMQQDQKSPMLLEEPCHLIKGERQNSGEESVGLFQGLWD